MILEPDSQWFRSRDGKHLLAGSPLTSFTVSDAGARILDAIEQRHELPPGHEQLTSRLCATGAAHQKLTDLAAAHDITVVIPAFARDKNDVDRVQSLVDSLQGINVIVVDDCSPVEVSIGGARLIRHASNRGPSASRNSGLAEVTSRYVAFIDLDAHAEVEALRSLASVLTDESVVLVAPRIATLNKKTGISEYESHHSPLDLGTEAAVVRPLSRVSYVPSTVVVAHSERLRQVGAFNEELRAGEDVDLVWRIVEKGFTVRYVPSIQCTHEARPTWRSFIQQRFSYGQSAAALDQHHPYAASPLRAHVLMAALATTILCGYLYLAALLILPITLYFVVALRSTKIPIRARLTVTRIGCVSTLRLVAMAVRRAWWPIFIIASFLSVRVTAMYTFSLLTPLMFGVLRKKPHAVASYVGLRIVDDLAYGLGVWVGAFRQRSLRCIIPVLTIRRTSRKR